MNAHGVIRKSPFSHENEGSAKKKLRSVEAPGSVPYYWQCKPAFQPRELSAMHSSWHHQQQQQSAQIDNGHSMYYPFVRSPVGTWICSLCQTMSFVSGPPDRSFIEKHMMVCSGGRNNHQMQVYSNQVHPENQKPVQKSTKNLVLPEDKEHLTEYVFYLIQQMELCFFSEKDRKVKGGSREHIKIGFPGIACRHCSNSSNQRKFFWANVDRISNSFAGKVVGNSFYL